MNINCKLLGVFLSVAENASFRKAADQTHRSMPAVSMQIKQLEEQVGVALFQRTTRKVSLTDEGEKLLISARKALAELEIGLLPKAITNSPTSIRWSPWPRPRPGYFVRRCTAAAHRHCAQDAAQGRQDGQPCAEPDDLDRHDSRPYPFTICLAAGGSLKPAGRLPSKIACWRHLFRNIKLSITLFDLSAM